MEATMRSLALERMSAEQPDEHLVNAARAGDRAAFSALFARDRDLVYAYAYARLRDREEAEDAVQETFVRAYLALGRLRGPAAWQAWLMQIVRNFCNDALRRKQVRRTEPMDPEWLDGGPSPEVQLLTEERRRALGAAVAALPEKYRVPLLMRFGGGRTRREIAVALGVPESTIIGRIAGAMRLLRRQLGEEWS
jgi:RNA polymerase sigma-70 factor, ECF subfamily